MGHGGEAPSTTFDGSRRVVRATGAWLGPSHPGVSTRGRSTPRPRCPQATWCAERGPRCGTAAGGRGQVTEEVGVDSGECLHACSVETEDVVGADEWDADRCVRGVNVAGEGGEPCGGGSREDLLEPSGGFRGDVNTGFHGRPFAVVGRRVDAWGHASSRSCSSRFPRGKVSDPDSHPSVPSAFSVCTASDSSRGSCVLKSRPGVSSVSAGRPPVPRSCPDRGRRSPSTADDRRFSPNSGPRPACPSARRRERRPGLGHLPAGNRGMAVGQRPDPARPAAWRCPWDSSQRA